MTGYFETFLYSARYSLRWNFWNSCFFQFESICTVNIQQLGLAICSPISPIDDLQQGLSQVLIFDIDSPACGENRAPPAPRIVLVAQTKWLRCTPPVLRYETNPTQSYRDNGILSLWKTWGGFEAMCFNFGPCSRWKGTKKGGVVCFFVFDLINPGQNQFGPQVFCLKGQRRGSSKFGVAMKV